MEKSYTEETKENGENKDKTYVKKCTTKASFCRLAFLGCIVITPAITPGMATSYSAIALRQLDLDLNKASWFASIMSLATPFGNLFTGFILDRCGRRISLILSILPSIIGWFLLSLENASVFSLYMGRILTGFALGAASLPSTVYLAECITINNLKLRGSLSTWTTLALSIGVLITYALGALVRYNEVAFTAFILSIASLLLILVFIPESPVWLYRRGRIGDALLAEARLGIAQPILQVKRSETISESTYDVETEFSIRSLIDFANKIKRKDVYKPFIITTSFLFFLQFSGIYALTGYMVDVIEVRSMSYNPYLLAVISGAVQCIGVMSMTFILPRTGVKNLSILSTACVAFGMFVLGVSIMNANTSAASSPFANVVDWIHVISVWFTVLTASFGFIVIPYSILGEMFPMGAKSYASLSLIASSTFNFIVLKLHPLLFAGYGPLIYFIYAVIALSGTIFVSLFLPETVGKTLDEIKNRFRYSQDFNSQA